MDYHARNRGLSDGEPWTIEQIRVLKPYSRKAEPPRLIVHTLIKDSSLIAASTSIDSATNLATVRRPRSETVEYQAFHKH